MERVEAALNGSAQNLPEIGENRYQGKLNAPATKAKEVVYPVMITATGDNGGVTEETRDLIVRNADLFPLEFTIARKNGEELGFLDQSVAIDKRAVLVRKSHFCTENRIRRNPKQS